MNEKGLKSPASRRLITIVLLLGISGTFMAVYYLVYLPQQQGDFNQRMFRILHEMAGNFSIRAEEYGTISVNSYVKGKYADKPVRFSPSDTAFDNAFKKSFTGNPDKLENLHTDTRFKNDTVTYFIKEDTTNVATSKKALSEILEPLIATHPNTFESFLLVKPPSRAKNDFKPNRRFDAVLYRSSNSVIANIATDSLFEEKDIQAAVLHEVEIEGTRYKIFLMPFEMKIAPDETFVLAGLISKSSYNKQSESIPVEFLFTIVVLLVLLLLCLPFLKVFVLSAEENITVSDVRFIIASIYILPLAITLIASSIWIYIYPEKFTFNVLSSLQKEIKDNFYGEIQKCIDQAKTYNSAIIHPAKTILQNYTSGQTSFSDTVKLKDELRKKVKDIDVTDLKDLAFYPDYKNIQVAHWIDTTGKDIASWGFTKDTTIYFNLKERQYFKDIKYKRLFTHPTSKDVFTLQATLSKLTGEFILNTVIPSHVQISPSRRSIALDITSKMSSIYNTVVPPGYEYCLTDQMGNIIFHSDTARNLEENLLDESLNDHLLQNALSHKDSVYIGDIILYDEPVKMMVKPFDDLPYYLVTYYKKRAGYLFAFHVVAFVFLCMSMLHLFVSIFSYSVMMTNKRISKLLFVPTIFNWLKPSFSKRDYYIRNSVQLIATLVLIHLFSAFLSPVQFQLYKLNYALLLPLFGLTGYYITKRAKVVVDRHGSLDSTRIWFVNRKEVLWFLDNIKNILLLYCVAILIFAISQRVFIYDDSSDNASVQVRVWILIVLLPIVVSVTAFVNINYFRPTINKLFGVKRGKSPSEDPSGYSLAPFIISLMVSVLLITVIPAITLTSFAVNEERKLHFQTFEIELAKKIQERRTSINPKFWQTKLNIDSVAANHFIDSLKFVKENGLYLGPLSLKTVKTESELYNQENSAHGSDVHNTLMEISSPFYKLITRFLFLPPDHDEFYDNESHRKFYYWTAEDQPHVSRATPSVYLHYRNLTDYKNPASFVLGGQLPRLNFSQDLSDKPLISLLLLILVILVFLFYKLIFSVAKRIFLIGYFNEKRLETGLQDCADPEWLEKRFHYVDKDKLAKISCFTILPTSFREIRKRENRLLKKRDDESILKIHLALAPAYENIWADCTNIEKYTLYDFSVDGFTNYKKVITLYGLYEKGLLVKERDNFDLMTISFRNFLLTKEKSDVVKEFTRQGKGSWSMMRSVFYVILLAVAIFIFLSQEEASKRLITIVTSLGALLPAILKLFDRSNFSSAANKSS